MADDRSPGLFSALLRHWRGRRGMSQLDLALAADVSSRHVSFLETGRAQPSEDMVLRLATTMQVPLREQNEMLVAAGFESAYGQPTVEEALAGPIGQAVERMFAVHEPYPMIVMNGAYDLLRMNHGAQALLGAFLADPTALGPTPNALKAVFDPAQLRPFVVDWERQAHALLSRLHREVLHRRHDERLAALLDAVLAQPGVPESWRQPDFSVPPGATITLRLRRGELEAGFLTTVTVFNGPMNVTLEELQIESYFPLDATTEETCRQLAASG
ncbi:MAG TPA: helix-turn-helix domain-containing protein [Polyangiaceae bacterium LLY-WYZ-15_(1-7)]|nr:transcriptional regulator [Myxococcales bacterium]MAT29668.1 transcriptional regulator [Sandaracinus sp.]HJL06441.1 helix-turn-helix domain-containing protein [Polyangiaceae bacterium LLY-WYZ-15_(1-7)]MBJ71421.1 transcriptional regulator [Sandaracinus sp.]HJL12311.1 helix-turn-helix domain-containing protein [Polyangiaceae bacterium LLY-WYZ-15_(1-7)]